MGFLIEIRSSTDSKREQSSKRDLIAEDELIKTHSKNMYTFLKSTLRYELKVPVKKSQMLRSDFDQYLKDINSGTVQSTTQAPQEKKSSAIGNDTEEEDSVMEEPADK